jgi:hypothetical protein
MANEQETVESMRYELGRDAKQKGEPLHEGASEEFYHGYSDGKGPGSNVMPKKFGKGRFKRTEWTCICGYHNKRYLNSCWICGTQRGLAQDATSE